MPLGRPSVPVVATGFQLVCLGLLLPALGCGSLQTTCGQYKDRIDARRSFLCWNVQSALGKAAPSNALPHVQLASLPASELNRLLATCPTPSPDTMQGHWIGVNRGLGPTFAGTTQFIKVFDPNGVSGGHIGEGTNVLVHQVPLDELAYRGWQLQFERKSGKVRQRGNFVIVLKDTIELDYTLAENPYWDPSRFLVDEIVQVEDGLLLGRANLQYGRLRIPVAYFALGRLP